MHLFTNDPPRPYWKRFVYRFIQWFTLIPLKVLFGYQYRHVDRLPMTGGALICPNHLSYLDPIMMGSIVPRRANFLAKKALFENKILNAILRSIDSIPIDREATGIGGMKETLKRLKKGESVIMFPEGERSTGGELLPLMTGFTALVKRLKVPVYPVGIHGSYEAWPPGGKPKPGRPIKLVVGHPILFSELDGKSQEEMAEIVGQRIAECYQEAREWNLGDS